MATITLGNLRDLWKNVSDWATGVSSVKPKVTVDPLGNTDDAEATGNGSLIAVAKNIRTQTTDRVHSLMADEKIVLTTSNLAADATYNQAGQDRFGVGRFNAVIKCMAGIVKASHAGTLKLQESEDNSAWSDVASVSVAAATTVELPWTKVSKRYYRFSYVNGATAQTAFILEQLISSMAFGLVDADGHGQVDVVGSLPAGDKIVGKAHVVEDAITLYPVDVNLIVGAAEQFSVSPTVQAASTWVDMFNFIFEPTTAGPLAYIYFEITYRVKATTTTADTSERIRGRNKAGTWVVISDEKATTDLGTAWVTRTTKGIIRPKTNLDSVPFEIAIQGYTSEADTLRLEVSSVSFLRAKPKL